MKFQKSMVLQWIIFSIVMLGQIVLVMSMWPNQKDIGYVDNAVLLSQFDKASQVREEMKEITGKLRAGIIPADIN